MYKTVVSKVVFSSELPVNCPENVTGKIGKTFEKYSFFKKLLVLYRLVYLSLQNCNAHQYLHQ